MSVAAIAEKLDELSKHELVQQLARAKSAHANFVKTHKGTIKRVATVAACTAVAAGSGAAAGLLELKMPLVPKTKLRIDLLVSGVLSLANVAGVAADEEVIGRVIQSSSDALGGHAWGRMAEKFALSKGVKRTATAA